VALKKNCALRSGPHAADILDEEGRGYRRMPQSASPTTRLFEMPTAARQDGQRKVACSTILLKLQARCCFAFRRAWIATQEAPRRAFARQPQKRALEEELIR